MKSATKLRVMCLIFGLGVVQAKPLEDSEVKRYNSNVSDFPNYSNNPEILTHTDSTPFSSTMDNGTIISTNKTERLPKTFNEISNFVYNALFGDPSKEKSNEKDSHNVHFKNHNSKPEPQTKNTNKSQNKKHKPKNKRKKNKNNTSSNTTQTVNITEIDKQKLDQDNITKTTINKTSTRPQPVLHIIISRWPEKSSASDLKQVSNLKQGWEDYGIPIPNPQPEVIPENPSGSIGSSISQIALQGQDLQQVSSNLPNILSHSAITLAQAGESGINPCPSIQIGSSLFGPSGRQGCPDLNIAFNTHLNGNLGSNRIPTVNQYDNVPVDPEVPAQPPADIGAPLADPVVADPVAADPIVADPAPLADPASAGAPATGGTQGGTGGLPSLPEFPSFPELPGLPEFPEFGEFFGMMGGLLRILWSLFGSNPLSPLTGMMMFGSLFPWWLPYLFLGGSSKSPEPEVTYYDHYYPPIKHKGGWYYNHDTNRWKNVIDHRKPRAYNITNTITLLDLLDNFIEKHNSANNNHTIISWKRRKK